MDEHNNATIDKSEALLKNSNDNDELNKIMEERIAIFEKNIFLNVKMFEHFNKKEVRFEDIISITKPILIKYYRLTLI